MVDGTGISLVEHFDELEDPRIERTKCHQLRDIIVIAICAVICGADNWVEIEEFGRSKQEWLEKLLGLPHGIPSHDTFGRVFARLDAAQFEACFVNWVQHLHELTRGQLLAIDGKTLRRSHDRTQKKGPLHLVNVWASASRLVLAQTEVAADSNEITAIPELLQMLELSGCIVSIDAIGCQKSIAQRITACGADNVLALKQNQSRLHDDVRAMFTLERKNECAHLPTTTTRPSKKTTVASKPDAVGSSLPLNSSTTWTLTKNGRNSRVWSWSKQSDNCRTVPHLKLAISSPACLPMPNCFWLPRVRTGALKTRSTGCWISPFARTTAASAKARLSTTWLSYAAWHSTSCATNTVPKSALPPNAKEPAGT